MFVDSNPATYNDSYIYEAAVDAETMSGPRPLSMLTLISMLPLLFVEVKQACSEGLRSHFSSIWNVLAALVLVSISITIVLSETQTASDSVIRVSYLFS